MKALIKKSAGIGNIELMEVPEPKPRSTEVKIEVKAAAICGTDIHIYYDEYPNCPPVVLGHNTGALCSDWTPTEEGYDTEEVAAHHKHAYRLIYKVRNHRDLFSQLYEKQFMDDDPDLVVVSYGTPSRVVNTAVNQARQNGLKVGALRLINLWPFPDEHFSRATKYLSVELNWDGQLVREVKRAAPKDAEVHFLGTCGDLPTARDLAESFETLLRGQSLARRGWELEAW